VPRGPIQLPQADFTLRAQMEVRAEHPETADKAFVMQHDRVWTYRQFRNESARMGRFLLSRLGAIDDKRPGHVAMLLENHLELVSLYGGCGVAGLTLFGINTGLRGDTLAGVINHARARVLVVDERLLPEVEKVRDRLDTVPAENILVVPTRGGKIDAGANLSTCLDREVGTADRDQTMPDVKTTPETNLMVIYTSGTTGLPKGINNNHMKLCFVGLGVSSNLGLGADDVGYACMPLFHSNAIFIGLMPAFWVGGSIGIRERFSASNFVPDVFKYGVTYWNYVGEPVHYVLTHLSHTYGTDIERLRAEVTNHPANKFRYAVGNGASPPDIDKFMDWMGLEDMFELYGSTEAAISTFRRKGDPRGSVGEVTDPNVKILDEKGNERPAAILDSDGKITNYEDAVGEICRVAADTSLFQGYFDNASANESKYRDGVYHSGDLGHILVRDGKRYLFFDGRTDDWIRKDGENFSALQVARLVSEHPDIPLAAAYGVPCSVSDELVMVALKMREGATFDPKGFFDFCENQVQHGGMDRKWFPDFVRVVDDFEYTGTQKILVRNLKAVHYDPRRVGNPLYFRERGDSSYKTLTAEDFEKMRKKFSAAEKLELLDR
jgi:fatty-acyl-CoA synthase